MAYSADHTKKTAERKKRKRRWKKALALVLTVPLLIGGCGQKKTDDNAVEMLNAAADACYKIEAFDDSGQCIAVGSGFSMYEEDLLFTCYHTIEGAACINAVNDEGQVTVADEILAEDEEYDLAVYRLPSVENASVLTPEEDLPQRGERVYTLASFGGITNIVSDGLAGGTWNQGMDYIMFTAPIAPGCSGGALLNEDGRLVGIICKSYEEGQSLNFAIPISYAVELYESLN